MSRLRWVKALIESHPLVVDGAVAVALAAFVLFDVLTSQGYLTASKAIYVPATLAMTVPLAWRRRAPLPVLLVVMSALVAESLAVGTAPVPDSQLVGWLLAVYSVAAHSARIPAAVGGAAGLAAGIVWIGFDDAFFPVVVFGGAWAAGRLVRQRHLYALVMEDRAAALEREQDAHARAAAAEERVRIARELHDIVGHSVGVMVVQAGVQRQLIDADIDATRDVLRSIEETGKEALTEMRRLVAVLRADDAGLELAPPASVAQLGALVQRMGEVGLPVGLRVEGDATALPPGVDLTAYRIVQEALTNALKYAHGTRADVVLRYSDDVLEVEIVDDGRGGTPENGAGHGLSGMRERAALFGGEIQTARVDGGGFLVRARLPIGKR